MAKVHEKPEPEEGTQKTPPAAKLQPQAKPSPKAEKRDQALEELKIEREQKQQLLDELLENADNFKKYTDFNAPREHLDVLRRTVCKNLNTAEFYYYLQVCHQVGLDPYLKQVWCYIDNKDNLVIIVGRDGFLAHCEKQEDFEGLISAPVYANDEFVPDYANGKIQHTSGAFKERGELVGAWAICYRKGRIPRLVTPPLDEYKKDLPKFGPWQTNPSAMIMKVAELEAMRKQFPMSGVQNEHDWDMLDNGRVAPHDKQKTKEENLQLLTSGLIKKQKDFIELLDVTKHPDKEIYRKSIVDARNKGELTEAMLDEYTTEILEWESKKGFKTEEE